MWCQSHYQGEKHCKTCKTGIYSICRGIGPGIPARKGIYWVTEYANSLLFI
ncbi:putative zinc ribbon protein [Morganella morganii]|uniref:putative zinc ribbon protein n=1 Tax=Morganella morganii TaxID=582 RepID=UPI00406BB9CD